MGYMLNIKGAFWYATRRHISNLYGSMSEWLADSSLYYRGEVSDGLMDAVGLLYSAVKRCKKWKKTEARTERIRGGTSPGAPQILPTGWDTYYDTTTIIGM